MNTDQGTEDDNAVETVDLEGVRPPVAAPGGLSTGTLLGNKYRLAESLGEGGMGEVFAAENLALGREVAVKVLLYGADHESVLRFQQEARACAKLAHGGIVHVYDFDTTADNVPFLVMERLHGESLRRAMKRSDGLTPAQIGAVGVDILDALACAHASGIVHRDIKPANVFLCDKPAPRTVLLDFGISQMDEFDIRLTRTGHTVGTPPYMSPEQLSGRTVGAASDIYSVGVLLFEALAGRLPYSAESIQHLQAQIITGERMALSDTCPALDAGMVRAIECMLAHDESARPTAAEARDMLAAALEGRSSAWAPPMESFHWRWWAMVMAVVSTVGALLWLTPTPTPTGANTVASTVPVRAAGNDTRVQRAEVPAPPPKQVTLVLQAKPQGARWEVDGVDKACNPCTLSEAPGTSRTATVSAPGHRARVVFLTFDEDRTIATSLEKRKRESPGAGKQGKPTGLIRDDPYAE